MTDNNGMAETKKKIIIADDSELNCEMVADILGSIYDYQFVHDSDTLLNMLTLGERADMILLDLNMPKTSGMQVLKVMRSRHWTDEIPVVIISAEDDDAIIQKAFELGATDYIVRPFQSFFVKHRIDNTLELYSQRRQLVRYVEKQVYERDRVNKALINIFGSLVELRNNESGEHTLHVQAITKMILNRLCDVTDKYTFTREMIDTISTVSALHDIGKAFIPSEILNKPSKLTDEEWEIMKSHTVRGDEFLQKIHVKNSEKFMGLAHEIVRYHHERYDGNGYPDGLCGDEIPISAQVVSIADVYDALTSDRCYKKAYDHEKALDMIRNGRCGVFNPLLVQCLMDISDDLLIMLKFNEVNDDDSFESVSMLDMKSELNDEIRVDERIEKLLDYEMEKKEFFAERCGGIQFEYDAERRKVVYMRRYDEKGERVHLSSESTRLLCDSDLEKLTDLISNMTPRNNTAEMNVIVPIGGDIRFHRLNIMSIWSQSGGRYKTLIGTFADIHEQVLKKNAKLSINGNMIDHNALIAMREVFDFVRLVDPVDYEVLKTDENGDIVRTGQTCYSLWGRTEPCQNCASQKCMMDKNWISKIEFKNSLGYSISSHPVKCDDYDCALEVGFCLDDSMKFDEKLIGYTSIDASVLQNYYRDTVTKTYSRAYLDTVITDLEKFDAIAMVDIDSFKGINDKYGHMVGDAVLKHVAKNIKACMKSRDMVIRYGGDEFVLVFFKIDKEDFFDKLDIIRNAVSLSHVDGYPDMHVGISIGGAYGVHPIADAIDTADKEMYKDKVNNKEEKT